MTVSLHAFWLLSAQKVHDYMRNRKTSAAGLTMFFKAQLAWPQSQPVVGEMEMHSVAILIDMNKFF